MPTAPAVTPDVTPDVTAAVPTVGGSSPGHGHWALAVLDDHARRRDAAGEAIPFFRLRREITTATSAADLARRLDVPEHVLRDRLDTLDIDESWDLAAHLANGAAFTSATAPH